MRKRERDSSRYQRVGFFSRWKSKCGTQSPFVASTKSVTPKHRLTITANRGCEYASIGPGKVVAVCGTLQAMQHGLPHRLIDFAPADELEDAEIFRLSRSCSMKLLLFGIWHANRLMTSAMRGRRQDFLPNFQASVFPRIFFFLLSFPPNGIARRCTFAHTLLAFWNNVYQYF
jgi:hypothetical protein